MYERSNVKKVLKCVSAMVFSCVTMSSVMGSASPLPIASEEMQQANPGLCEAYNNVLADHVRNRDAQKKISPLPPYQTYIVLARGHEQLLRASYSRLWEYVNHAMIQGNSLPFPGFSPYGTQNEGSRLGMLALAASNMKASSNITVNKSSEISKIKAYNDFMRIALTQIPRDQMPVFFKNKTLSILGHYDTPIKIPTIQDIDEICELLGYGIVSKINMSCTNIPAQVLARIMQASANSPITELKITSNNSRDAIYGFPPFHDMVCLRLHNVSLSEQGFREIGCIAQNGNLSILELPNIQRTSEVRELFQKIKTSQVKELQIGSITGENLEALAVSCPKSIQEISLGTYVTEMTENDFYSIRKLIANNKNLRVLNLPEWYRITDKDLPLRDWLFDIALSGLESIKFSSNEQFASITKEKDSTKRIEAATKLFFPDAKLYNEEEAQSASSSSSSSATTASVKEEEEEEEEEEKKTPYN